MASRNNLPVLLRHSIKEAVPVVILTIGAVLVSLPLLWMFSTSLRPSSESYKLPPNGCRPNSILKIMGRYLTLPCRFLRCF